MRMALRQEYIIRIWHRTIDICPIEQYVNIVWINVSIIKREEPMEQVEETKHGPGLCVKELQPYLRPRERFMAVGAEQISTEELIAILLRTGRKGASVLDIAKELLSSLEEGDYGLNGITEERLMKVKGIGRDKAITLCAAIELGRRLGQLKVKHTYEDFSRPQAVAMYMMNRLRFLKEEHFCAALLTVKNTLIKVVTLSTGGIASSLAEQRTLFRYAIEANAGGVILLHNHPSGDPTESKEDIMMTRVFQKAGDVMGIPILDHIIIGDGIYVSLCEKGII